MAEVHVAECLCADPELHRDKGETITFKEPAMVDFVDLATADKAVYIWRSVERVGDTAGIMARLSQFYLLHFITKWTLRGEDKKPLPVTADAVQERILSRPLIALDLADFADGLYAETVFSPLVERVSKLAGTSQPEDSSSQTPPPAASNREQKRASGRKGTPSKPSSTSTTPMAATIATP